MLWPQEDRAMRLIAVLVCLGLGVAEATAQSLGEAAARERERQEKIRRAGGAAKVVTAEELEANPGTLANDPGIPPAVAATPLRPSSRTLSVPGARATASSAGAPARTGSGGQGEAYWRGRMTAARSAVAAAEKALARVEREDAIQRNDPDYGHPKVAGLEECKDVNDIRKRSTKAWERDVANNAKANCEAAKRWFAANPRPQAGDVERARATLAQAKQAVLDLEEEARRAGAAPGWLR
jgi:hypothetical protein